MSHIQILISSTNLTVEIHATASPTIEAGHVWLTTCHSVQEQAYMNVKNLGIYWPHPSTKTRGQQSSRQCYKSNINIQTFKR